MERKDEDALWREIVDNYGDTAPGEEPDDESLPAPEVHAVPQPDPSETDNSDDLPRAWEDEGHFTPPAPDPIPLAAPPRMLAWLGVFGSPIIALVAWVLGHPFRGVLALLMVAWFVGGFVYLVRTMGDEPRDPWDDGSRI